MARPVRNFTEGLYHVSSKASDTRFLFVSDANRLMFLHRLAATLSTFELGLVTYTLMGTHYHLVLSTPGDRVSTALQRLNSWYSHRLNKLLGRSAHLFKAHPFARQIESNDDLLGVCRYVARNPVEAALVTTPLAWRWGGARANSGLELPAIPLDEEPLRAALSNARDWRARYRDYIEREEDPAEKPSQPG